MSSAELTGKVAVITGAGRGIGREIALLFAQQGAAVVLSSRSVEPLEETANRVRSTGSGAVLSIVADVTDQSAVDRMVTAALDEFGRIDILVNNAGVSYVANLIMSDENEWRRVIETNVFGVYRCTKAAIRPMIKARSGRVINVSSVSGKVGAAFNSAYAASKAAVIGFTKSVALETAKLGITVNAICPWHVETDLVHETMEARGKMFGRSDREHIDQVLGDDSQRRLITAFEVASLALFLASPASSGITGEAWNVCGGNTTV
ncbi:MAG: SDR family oxidoreductase [Planctomycetes bacterium]|nr:SDR family oxidoreductase [Planctomycetota bacterium]MBI3843463.1 SDR family oxidoreductase [Planctomycetota bacterium]